MKHPVCQANEMKPGEVKEIRVKGRRILLCCIGDSEFRAVSAICPHQNADLVHIGKLDGEVVCNAEGEIKLVKCNEIVRCPRHAYEWDVHNGKALFETKKYNLKSYHVIVEGGQVLVEA